MTVTITPVNVGTVADDGTGDPARTAFQSLNQNDQNIKSAVEALQSAPAAHVHEGTAIKSTGEGGGTKVLTEQGDDSCAWAEPAAAGAFTADGDTLITPTTPIVLDQATGDEDALRIDYQTNKASSGDDTGLVVNQTDTSSPGTSYLQDWQVGGVSKTSVNNLGNWAIPAGTKTAPSLAFNDSTAGLYSRASGFVMFSNESKEFLQSSINNTLISGYLGIGAANGDFSTTAADVLLNRDAADILAFRRAANAQTFRTYKTYTNTTNYERLAITGDAITVETAGTGTDNIDLTLTPAGTGVVKVGSNTVANLGTAQEYTKTQNFNATTLSDGASIAWDLESNQVCSVTLGGNRALANPTNKVDGATYVLIVKQDGTGTRTLSYGTDYLWEGGTAPTLTTTATTGIDILTFICHGTNMYGTIAQDFS